MRIFGNLMWFDENPDDLARAISSQAALGLLDTVIAVDGRYALYGRGGPNVSSKDQYDAIAETCSEHAVDFCIMQRVRPWAGEIDKRGRQFRLALALADVGTDWICNLDADMETVAAPPPNAVRDVLTDTELHVAEVTHVDVGSNGETESKHLRHFFRAWPGMTPYGRHSYYVAQIDGEWKWLWDPVYQAVPALQLHDIVVSHTHTLRDSERQKRSYDYYTDRDQAGPELEPPMPIETALDGYPVRVDREEIVAREAGEL